MNTTPENIQGVDQGSVPVPTSDEVPATDTTNGEANEAPLSDSDYVKSVESFYSLADAEQATALQDAINQIIQRQLAISSNFKLTADKVDENTGEVLLTAGSLDASLIPSGFGVILNGISKQVDDPSKPAGSKTRVLIGVAIAAVPDFDTIWQYATQDGGNVGEVFVRETIMDVFAAHIANVARPKADEDAMQSLAGKYLNIVEFIEGRKRGGDGAATFNKVASALVQSLKQLNFTDMTKDTLKLCLQSSATSSNLYPVAQVPAETWPIVIEMGITLAKNKGLDPAWFHNCLATRDEVSAAVAPEITIESLRASMTAMTANA